MSEASKPTRIHTTTEREPLGRCKGCGVPPGMAHLKGCEASKRSSERGALDSAHLAGINGIPMPAGLTVGDEFDLNVRVRIYELKRDKVDVSTMDREQYLDGALHADLLVVDFPWEPPPEC